MGLVRYVMPIAYCAAVGCMGAEAAPEGSSTTRREAPSAMDSLLVRMSAGEFDPADLQTLERAARAGDYQAQRNLAWWLEGNGEAETPRVGVNRVKACAWRMVILVSGSERVDDSDVLNKEAACDRALDANGIVAASAQAKRILLDLGSAAADTTSGHRGGAREVTA